MIKLAWNQIKASFFVRCARFGTRARWRRWSWWRRWWTLRSPSPSIPTTRRVSTRASAPKTRTSAQLKGDALLLRSCKYYLYLLYQIRNISVAEPDPQDPHVFGPPGSGSGSISQRYGSKNTPKTRTSAQLKGDALPLYYLYRVPIISDPKHPYLP